ncbi:sigma-70 family RNA polymerase sigma factor [Phytopseudomonas dryadis]|uniref:RNA polymerase subunit sigma n=1 Tax=Phytopseudomonas dryadis TaxID=2487520 RepID=A0A4V2KBF3_9GAMM|nr:MULTISPECIES: sigma-70 family RNA polymerase sigma factor [Pseudomonas]TBU85647.1 RNA polymerase subunit sigma [Pseudomonas dryadis]TBV02041.1 RNA polymerase subunit sigma [Pseudomonas dryadis]TBV14852.1 RNA polymerase subunit sigma [Pseudomonas sp. FRB 230]
MSDSHSLIQHLFEQNHAWLRSRLRARTGCQQHAEDLAAETFLRVLSMPAPERIREPRALLTTIAYRLLYESWRRRDLEKAYLRLLAETPEEVQPSPEEQLELLERLLHLDRLLGGLPGQTKTVFVCSFVEGLTYSQISQRMGLSVTSIHRLMAAALHNCWEALADER